MSTKGRYRTKQRQGIVEYLLQCQNSTWTAEAVRDGMRQSGVVVGQATVYRTLNRLCEAGTVVKVPSSSGNETLFCYVGECVQPSCGTLVCLKCGRTFPIECSQLKELLQQIHTDYEFEIDPRHIVLCGYCRECKSQE